jgi:anthranilate synthase/aminodeoxychorismate synthase-like glutamine amidotransferase
VNVLLIDCEDSYTLNIYDYLRRIDIHVKILSYHDFKDDFIQKSYDAIILSPGPNEAISYPKLMNCIADNEKNIPILGICLGHQILGHYYGHLSIKAKKAIHGVPVNVLCRNHPLFDFLDHNTMQVMPYHSLIISKNETSPLEILATNSDDEIMAFAHKALPIAGFQFHPESIGTPRGLELLISWKNWIKSFQK